MLAIVIILLSVVVVYALAWGVTWLIGRFVDLPPLVREVLPWFLFHLYLVVGLIIAGDLPGASRAVLHLLAGAAVLSLVIGMAVHLFKCRDSTAGLTAWLLAGTPPWAVALLLSVA